MGAVWPEKIAKCLKVAQKMISLEKLIKGILTPLQKLTKNVGNFGKNVAKGLNKLHKVK